jgi:hypothetical protein
VANPIVDGYKLAVAKARDIVVAYSGPIVDALASRPTVELMLQYSIVPLDAAGRVPTNDKAIAYVAMPHVAARGDCGDGVKRACKGTFGAAGFAGSDSTPASRRKAAETLAVKLVALQPSRYAPKVRQPKPAASVQPPASAPVESESPAAS